MSLDFNFTDPSWFLGNVRIKSFFNTQWPPPPPQKKGTERYIEYKQPFTFLFLDLPSSLVSIPLPFMSRVLSRVFDQVGLETMYASSVNKHRLLVSLTVTLFSEKMLISTKCVCGLMSNLIKKILKGLYLWTIWEVGCIAQHAEARSFYKNICQSYKEHLYT